MAGSSHGHTPAAWTGVTIAFIGFCVGGVFTVTADPVGFWVGIGVVLLGGVVGLGMKLMGLGMPQESAELAQARAEAGRSQTEGYGSEADRAEEKTHQSV
ncbi:HGxxPAAW family protein [Streptomyces liangshanensis]|uniref:HGxxPAAW family protein n=1 Tax=Streptomyces liangshanensis TaxID=2717324 RepID=UPI0036DD9FE4